MPAMQRSIVFLLLACLWSVPVGAGVSHRVTDANQEFKLSARPDSHLTDAKYLNTGKISDVESISLLGLEAAWVQGPFSLQGEYIAASVNRDAGDVAGDDDPEILQLRAQLDF